MARRYTWLAANRPMIYSAARIEPGGQAPQLRMSGEASSCLGTCHKPFTLRNRMTLASPLPLPTPADAKRVNAMTHAVATAMRRHNSPSLGAVDQTWLEGRPQTLLALLDTTVAASTAEPRERNWSQPVAGCSPTDWS
jgi:hypothetical protein